MGGIPSLNGKSAKLFQEKLYPKGLKWCLAELGGNPSPKRKKSTK